MVVYRVDAQITRGDSDWTAGNTAKLAAYFDTRKALPWTFEHAINLHWERHGYSKLVLPESRIVIYELIEWIMDNGHERRFRTIFYEVTF